LLTPGRIVHGRVIAKLGSGQFRVTLGDYSMEASSDLPLEAGQRLTARIEFHGSRLLLRVQEDESRFAPISAEAVSSEEIKRVLSILGLPSGSIDVIEFKERLTRYQPHGSLSGIEPSDVWILGILWARGIRGGADAFALLSYYLRAKTMQWSNLEDRQREAIALLNRNEATCGRFGESPWSAGGAGENDPEGTDLGFVLRRRPIRLEGLEVRSCDHPVLPTIVLTAPPAERFSGEDTEELRARFWRTWEENPAREVRA
jgi:hypothetical protein